MPQNFVLRTHPSHKWAPPVHAATGGHGFGTQCPSASDRTEAEVLQDTPLPGGDKNGRFRVFEVSREVYDKVAYRGGTEGIIAEVFARNLTLDELELPQNPLIAVLESVEKPGNLGAVLRSADAAGADALLVCDPLTDIYNPNVIRASIGAVFTVPVVACTSAEAIGWLKRNGIRILTAQLQDSSAYYDCDMRRGTALVMGTESTGLSQAWRDAADAHIRIPMLGRLDSLNVSVSASILLFEAVRQRQ
ncbi:MAG: RNA methyltransferase [Bacteroidales bacterium]|nr:RNA methyltransferase [Bacteroidales bacterium]